MMYKFMHRENSSRQFRKCGRLTNNILNLSCSHSISFNAAKRKFDCRDIQQYEFNHHVHCTLCVDVTIHHTPDRELKIENLLHKIYKWMLSMLRVSDIYRIINKQQGKNVKHGVSGSILVFYSLYGAIREANNLTSPWFRLTLSQSLSINFNIFPYLALTYKTCWCWFSFSIITS